MVRVTFVTHEGARKTVEAAEGDSVMATAIANGLDEVIGECGGSMMCATCHCYVDDAWADSTGAQAACDHARNIAKRLAKGDADSYNSVPWFWSDQSDYKLQIAGLAAPDDDAVVREDGAVLRFAGNVLTAVETINNAKTHMTARRLLAQDTPPGRDSLEQTNYQLSLE